MKQAPTSTKLEARRRRGADVLVEIVKWPAIGALVGGGVLFVGRVAGPSIAKNLGARAGEGLVEGWAKAREKAAAIQRQLDISGWGTYR